MGGAIPPTVARNSQICALKAVMYAVLVVCYVVFDQCATAISKSELWMQYRLLACGSVYKGHLDRSFNSDLENSYDPQCASSTLVTHTPRYEALRRCIDTIYT